MGKSSDTQAPCREARRAKARAKTTKGTLLATHSEGIPCSAFRGYQINQGEGVPDQPRRGGSIEAMDTSKNPPMAVDSCLRRYHSFSY
jgi:hypothetical protein